MPAVRNQRNRTWCFTVNNPTEAEIELIKTYHPELAKWIVFQKEEGEAGTPHLQGVIGWKSPMTLSNVRAKVPRAHLEICRDAKASVAYCQKEEGRLDGPWKLGAAPQPGKRNDLLEIRDKIKGGASEQQIADEHFGTWCRNYRAFDRYRLLNMKRRDWKTEVFVYWGPTGIVFDYQICTGGRPALSVGAFGGSIFL